MSKSISSYQTSVIWCDKKDKETHLEKQGNLFDKEYTISCARCTMLLTDNNFDRFHRTVIVVKPELKG